MALRSLALETGALSPLASTNRAPAGGAQPGGNGLAAKARAQAQDFEAMFLNAMVQNMFTGIGEEGPLGDATGVGIWRSFLTDEYAKTFVKAGGVGIADCVYGALLAQQEARAESTSRGAVRQ